MCHIPRTVGAKTALTTMDPIDLLSPTVGCGLLNTGNTCWLAALAQLTRDWAPSPLAAGATTTGAASWLDAHLASCTAPHIAATAGNVPHML